MKKVISLIIFVIIIGIVSMFYYSETKIINESFYVIDSHYSFIYENNKRYNIDIYSDSANSIIEYVDDNIYQIVDGNDIYTLINVKIKKEKVNKYHVYQLSFDIFDIGKEEKIIENPILKITNQKYTLKLNIGDIYILKPTNYELLNINNYYASYSYLNEALMLVGLNIELNDEFNTIYELKVGNYASARLDLALKNTLLNNEINIKEVINNYRYNELCNYNLNLEAKTYFIPITYDNLKVIKASFITLNIDDKNYYLDYFPFITNILDLDDYKNYIREGQISYV